MKISTMLFRQMVMLMLLSLSSICSAQTYDGGALPDHESAIASLMHGSPASPSALSAPAHFSPPPGVPGLNELSWLPGVSTLLPSLMTNSPVAGLLTDSSDLPEPGLLALVLLGLLSISLSRRRSARQEVSAGIARL